MGCGVTNGNALCKNTVELVIRESLSQRGIKAEIQRG